MTRGRPREFEISEALDRAMVVFWRKGYEGASLDDLTEAMGINRPSLYSAFGSKEGLFRQVLDRYAEGPGAFVNKALAEPTARKVAKQLLAGAAEMVSNPGNPHGCLVVQGALACGEGAESVRRELVARRDAGLAALKQRFDRAAEEGDLRPQVDRDALARFILAVIHGMAVQAAGGASRAELHRVVEVAMKAWPA